MRDRVNAARQLLAERGINITNADLQAIWWYPEKNLYAKMGGRDSQGINVDYATAIADIARKKGIPEDVIARAMGAAPRRPRPARLNVRSGSRGSGAQSQGANDQEGSAEPLGRARGGADAIPKHVGLSCACAETVHSSVFFGWANV